MKIINLVCASNADKSKNEYWNCQKLNLEEKDLEDHQSEEHPEVLATFSKELGEELGGTDDNSEETAEKIKKIDGENEREDEENKIKNKIGNKIEKEVDYIKIELGDGIVIDVASSTINAMGILEIVVALLGRIEYSKRMFLEFQNQPKPSQEKQTNGNYYG